MDVIIRYNGVGTEINEVNEVRVQKYLSHFKPIFV